MVPPPFSCSPPQEKGLDTVDANRALGLPDDCREYTSVRNILQQMGIKSIRLIVGAARFARTHAARVACSDMTCAPAPVRHACACTARRARGCGTGMII